MANQEIAQRLREVADLLALQEASPYRVLAYRRAADLLESLEEPAGELLEKGGVSALTRLPGIDHALAGAIAELTRTGRLALLDRLRGNADPEALFRRVPGIGPKLARLIHEALHIDTLEALELAAHDGRLEAVPGVGPRRALAIRSAISQLLGRVRPHSPVHLAEPEVSLLLDVDREYRVRAARGELQRIAPRRFNPRHEPWLPVLHTQRGPWRFTALFSNTARAHQLGRTRDWVILYFTDGTEAERQRTVVTETHGPLEGERVVRGREVECLRRIQPREEASWKSM
jgi:putative hydrolase